MQELGEQLRRARWEKNLTLKEISHQTKIQLRHLEALEKGDPTPFAGEVYFKGALRSYAGKVGLDPDQILNLYYELKGGSVPRAEAETPAGLEQADPVSRRERSSSPFNWLLILLVAASLAALAWFLTSGNRDITAPPAPPEEVTPPPPEEPVAPPKGDEEETGFVQVTIAQDRSSGGETAYNVTGVDRLEANLSFIGSCWVRLSSDDRLLYEETFRAGRELAIEGEEKISLRLGYPPGVRITVNGLPIEGLSEQLTAHNYLFVLTPPDS